MTSAPTGTDAELSRTGRSLERSTRVKARDRVRPAAPAQFRRLSPM